MLKLFNLFKNGFITLFTLPFWLVWFLIKMIICLIVYFITLIKAIIDFFQGKLIFKTKEDKAIDILRQNEEDEMRMKREEAMRNADLL